MRDSLPPPATEPGATTSGVALTGRRNPSERVSGRRVRPYGGVMSDHPEAPVTPLAAPEPPFTWRSSARCGPRTRAASARPTPVWRPAGWPEAVPPRT